MKIDSLFPKIDKSCKKCNTCCRTYGWLSKQEAKKFIKKGYSVAKINNNLYCIDSFMRNKKNKIIADKIPICIFYKNNRCLIQKNKPLDCRLFPIKIKFINRKPILGLSLGCNYISSLNKEKRLKLEKRIVKFFNENKKLMKEYVNLMKKVNDISKPKKFWMKKIAVIKNGKLEPINE